MTRIHGVLCDGCGVSDLVKAEDLFSEDNLPRNEWMSLNVWHGEENPEVGPEIHACSTKCLRIVADKLEGVNQEGQTNVQ
jgi:hypothetical protein